MIKIAPSLFNADFSKLGEQIKAVEEAGADMLHLDVMDGNFVPNIAFGPDQIKMLRPMTKLFFDVHMMVQDPDRFIPRYVDAGADMITVHAEATKHLPRSLKLIKDHGVKCGAVLNPATPVEELKYVLDDVDMILIMTCNPGGGAGGFIPAMMQKVADLKALIGDRDIDIQVDGGVNDKIAPDIVKAGANVIVAGSFTYNGVPKENIEKLRNAVK